MAKGPRHGVARRLGSGFDNSVDVRFAVVFWIIGVLLLPHASTVQAQEDGADPRQPTETVPLRLFTVEETIELALDNAPAILVADEGINLAQAQELEATLTRLPTITGRVTLAPAGAVRGNPLESSSRVNIAAVADIFDEFSYQLNASIRATVPLYTFGKIELAESLAHVGFEVSMMQHEKTQLELIFNVRQAYLGLQLSRVYAGLLEEGEERLTEAREDIEDRRFEGTVDASEIREFTIFEADFISRRADNRLLTELSSSGIRYYTGIEGDFDVTSLNEDVPPPLADLETFIALAWVHRPDLKLLEFGIEAADLARQLAWRQLVPNLFFALGFSYARNPLADDQVSPFAFDPYNSSGLAFLVGLDWRFDFRQVGRARRAAVQQSRTEARAAEAIGGIELEIEQAYIEAVGQQERVEARRAVMEEAEAWLNQRSLQYEDGMADLDDLIDPMALYYTSAATFYQAVFDSELARANLALKVGLGGLSLGSGLADPE